MLLFVYGLLCLYLALTHSKTLYVDQSDDTGADCTFAEPCGLLEAILSCQDNDVVIIMEVGLYNIDQCVYTNYNYTIIGIDREGVIVEPVKQCLFYHAGQFRTLTLQNFTLRANEENILESGGYGENFVFKDVIIENGENSMVFYTERKLSGSLIFENCIIRNFENDDDKPIFYAGLVSNSFEFRMTDCQVINIKASTIFHFVGNSFQVTNSDFENIETYYGFFQIETHHFDDGFIEGSTFTNVTTYTSGSISDCQNFPLLDDIHQFVIKDSHFENCQADFTGEEDARLACICAYKSNLEFEDCSFRDFSRYQINVMYSSIYVGGTDFYSNSYSDSYGVNVILSETLSLIDSVFDGNVLVKVERVEDLTLIDTNFTTNSRILMMDDSNQDHKNSFENAVVQNCRFSDALSTPFMLDEGYSCESVRIEGCVFENISSSAIELYCVNYVFEMKDTIIRKITRRSSGSKGVVKVGLGIIGQSQNSEALVYNSTFEDFQLETNGTTGLNIEGSGKLVVHDSTFSRGYFQDHGMLTFQLDEVEIKNSRFEDCHVLDENFGEGGAIYSFREDSAFRFSITNTTFDRCSAGGRGGSIYLNGLKSLEVEEVSIRDSEAKEEGGGMHLQMFKRQSSVTISVIDCDFSNCRSRIGGGIYLVKMDDEFVAESVISGSSFENCFSDVSGSSVFISAQSMVLEVVDTMFRNCSIDSAASSFHTEHYFDRDSGKLGRGSLMQVTFQRVESLNSKVFLKDIDFYAFDGCFFSKGKNAMYDSIFVSDGTKGSIDFSETTVLRSNKARPPDEIANRTLMYLRAGDVSIPSGMVIEGINETDLMITLIVTGRAELRDWALGREDHPVFSVYSDGVVVFSNCSFEGLCKELMNIQMIGKGLMIYDSDFIECEGNIIDTSTYFSDESLYFMTDGIVLSKVNVISPRTSVSTNPCEEEACQSLDLSVFRLEGYGSLTIDEFVLDGGLCEEHNDSELYHPSVDQSAFLYIRDIRGSITISNSEFRNNQIYIENYSILRLGQVMAASSFSFENVAVENNHVGISSYNSYIVSIDFPPVGTTIDCLFDTCEFRNNSNDEGYGGSIFNRNGYIEFKDCTLESNSALMGGAVYSEGGSIYLSGDTKLLDHRTSGSVISGCIHLEGGGVKVLDSTKFDGSDASCVYVYDGSIQVSPSASFMDCHAGEGNNGGAINLITNTPILAFPPSLGGSYERCSAGSNGGAISFRFLFDSDSGEDDLMNIDVTFDISQGSSSNFVNCEAGLKGGVLYFENVNLMIFCEANEYHRFSFNDNRAVYGGAACTDSSVLAFDPNCTLDDDEDSKVYYFDFHNNTADFGSDVFDFGVIRGRSNGIIPDNLANETEWICYDYFDTVVEDEASAVFRCFRNYVDEASFPFETSSVKPVLSGPPSRFVIKEVPEILIAGQQFSIVGEVRDIFGNKVSYFDGFSAIIDMSSNVQLYTYEEELLEEEEQLYDKKRRGGGGGGGGGGSVDDSDNIHEENIFLKSSVFKIPLGEVDDVVFNDVSFSRETTSEGTTVAEIFVGIQRDGESGYITGSFAKFLLSPCPMGMFRDDNDGEVICSPCAKGMYTALLDEEECQECPDDAECDLQGKEGVAVADKGYWAYTDGNRVEVIACSNGKCLRGNNCSLGYDSNQPICASCIEGYAEWNDGCSECDGWSRGKFLVLVIFIVFLVCQVLSVHLNSQVAASSIERIFAFFGQSYKLALDSVSWGYVSEAFSPFLALLSSYTIPSGEPAIGNKDNAPFLAKMFYPFSYVFAQAFACPFERSSYMAIWGDYFNPAFMLLVILVMLGICILWKLLECSLKLDVLAFSYIRKKIKERRERKKKEKSRKRTVIGIMDIADLFDSSSDDEEDQVVKKEEEDNNKPEEEEKIEVSKSQISALAELIHGVFGAEEGDEEEEEVNKDGEEAPKRKVLFKKKKSEEEEEEGGEDIQVEVIEVKEEQEQEKTEDTTDLENIRKISEDLNQPSEKKRVQKLGEEEKKQKRLEKKRRKEQIEQWTKSSPLDFWIAMVENEMKYRNRGKKDFLTYLTGCPCWNLSCRMGLFSCLKRKKEEEKKEEEDNIQGEDDFQRISSIDPDELPSPQVVEDEDNEEEEEKKKPLQWHEWYEEILRKLKKVQLVPEKYREKWYLFLSYLLVCLPGLICTRLISNIFTDLKQLFFKYIPYQRTIINFIIVTYALILNNSIGYITCFRYQDHYRNVRRSDIHCFDGKWFENSVPLLFLPLLYCIIIPIVLFMFLFCNKRKMYREKTGFQSHSFDEKFGTLYLCYRKNCWWYELFSFFRKFVFIMLMNLSTTWDELGGFLLCMTLGSFFLIHLLCLPYQRVFSNILEGLVLICLFLLQIIRSSDVYDDFEQLAIIVVFFSFVPVFILLSYLRFRIFFISCLKYMETFFIRKCLTSCLVFCGPNIFTIYWCCFFQTTKSKKKSDLAGGEDEEETMRRRRKSIAEDENNVDIELKDVKIKGVLEKEEEMEDKKKIEEEDQEEDEEEEKKRIEEKRRINEKLRKKLLELQKLVKEKRRREKEKKKGEKE